MSIAWPETSPLAHELVTLEEIGQRLHYSLATVKNWAYGGGHCPMFPPAIDWNGRLHLRDWPLVHAWAERTGRV